MSRNLHYLSFTLLFVSVLLIGCDRTSTISVDHHTSGMDDVISLDVTVDNHNTHLLLAGHAAGSEDTILRYMRSDDGGDSWSKPVSLPTANAPVFKAHRGMDVQIAASGDRLVALWMTAGTGSHGGAGPMSTATSQDGGKTWHPAPNPADDGSTEGHAFFDLTSAGNNSFHVVWLDSRNGKQALYTAHSSDGGQHWDANTSIDAATCECCWNIIKAAPNNKLFVLYRDIDPRDMALATSNDGKTWHQAGPVGNFNWRIDGCPHTGGGLAIGPESKQLHAVAWTGKEDAAGLYYLRSHDGGQQWRSPHRLGDQSAQHADIALFGADHVAAVWDVSDDTQSSAIEVAISADGGQHWATQQLADHSTSPTHPRIITTRHGWRVFWTEQKDGASMWATTSLPVE